MRSRHSVEEKFEIELLSLPRILDILIDEKEKIMKAAEREFSLTDQVITTIPGIGPITGFIV